MPAIQTLQLTKTFGNTTACNQISLHVEQGEIYGFLGLNGAGKTTLIRMLLGMIKPDSGSIKIFDKPVDGSFDNWNNIGYLVETPAAYPNLTVAENLKVYYHLRRLTNPVVIDEIMELLKLTPYRNKKAKVLSLGNAQRLGLAKALMHRPKLLILDEPINGLDPEGIVEVRQLLKQLAAEGTTIFLSSHILGEITKLVNRVGIIHSGSMVKELTTDELHHQLTKKVLVTTTNNQLALQLLQQQNHGCSIVGNEIVLNEPTVIEHPESITALLAANNLPPQQIHTVTEDLEMFFLRTIRNTGHE